MCQQVYGAKWLQNMFTFTWHIDTFYICVSNILHGIYMWYYIYLEVFFSIFLGMTNGGGLPLPRELGFHPGALPFAPPPNRAVLHFPNPSIVWNILIFAS
jgi:hypothetical protein